VAFYRLLQKRLGTTRNVIIQPSAYGLDNRCTVDALQQMGSNTRAVAVIDLSFPNSELRRMQDIGVRGIRFNNASEVKVNTIEMIEPLSRKIKDLGWHLQIRMLAADIVETENLLTRLPSKLVIDHLGHLPEPDGTDHPAFRVICKLIDKGNTWVKLSCFYSESHVGPPTYADSVKVARAYVKYAPERLVWGSDWPHPSIYSEKKPMVDDAALFDLLGEAVPDERTLKRILVDNPAVLYDFPR
jgi:predicted TIM-barrel fold metal-dependent hydrolase